MLKHILTSMLLVCTAVTPAAFAADQKAFYEPAHFESEPGLLFYMFQEDSFWEKGTFSAQKHGTADCVTPPCALECYFPPADGPAGVLALDLQQAFSPEEGQVSSPTIPSDAAGVAFYVKGDGSKGAGRVELRGDDRKPGPAFEFALSDAAWHAVVVTWDKFTPAADASKATILTFGIAGDTARPATYRVDALRFVKTVAEDSELAQLAASANARKEPAAEPYRVAPGACAYNKGGLARAREKVRKGEPTKWLAYGDSVTVPVQLWNIPDKYRDGYAYYRVAAAMLENEYHAKIDVTVNAVGGRHLSQSFDEFAKAVDAVKPDVIIMHPWDTRAKYAIYMPKALAKAREAGAEIVVMAPVYNAFAYRDPAIDWLRNWCIENNVACADARTYLLAPGEIYWGGLFANPYHPCPEGHRLMGQVLAEMFR